MFIGRRPDNSIYGLWAVRQWVGQEELPDDHPDVIAFRNPPAPDATSQEASCIAGTSSIPEPKYGFDLHRAFIAHVISCEAYRLNKTPATMTGADLAAIRQRVANIYKAL